MNATQVNLADIGVTEPIRIMLFDAGYLSEDNLTAEGPDRLIATGKGHRLHHAEPTSGDPPDGASPIDAMNHRLQPRRASRLPATSTHRRTRLRHDQRAAPLSTLQPTRPRRCRRRVAADHQHPQPAQAVQPPASNGLKPSNHSTQSHRPTGQRLLGPSVNPTDRPRHHTGRPTRCRRQRATACWVQFFPTVAKDRAQIPRPIGLVEGLAGIGNVVPLSTGCGACPHRLVA